MSTAGVAVLAWLSVSALLVGMVAAWSWLFVVGVVLYVAALAILVRRWLS